MACEIVVDARVGGKGFYAKCAWTELLVAVVHTPEQAPVRVDLHDLMGLDLADAQCAALALFDALIYASKPR